jgi:hypothetical protein
MSSNYARERAAGDRGADRRSLAGDNAPGRRVLTERDTADAPGGRDVNADSLQGEDHLLRGDADHLDVDPPRDVAVEDESSGAVGHPRFLPYARVRPGRMAVVGAR